MAKADITRQDLSVAQENAVDCLVSGMNDAETGAAVSVSRQTVNGWRNHDPLFQAELNRRRRDIWGHSTDRLRALVPRALTVLEGAIVVNPDPTIALKIIQLAGLTEPGAALGQVGPTSAEAVINAEIIRRREETDPLAALVSGGPITATERRALVGELKELEASAHG